MANALDCGIVVSEFELQSCFYIQFRTDTLGKKYDHPYPSSYELNSTTIVLLQGGIKYPTKVEMSFKEKEERDILVIIQKI